MSLIYILRNAGTTKIVYIAISNIIYEKKIIEIRERQRAYVVFICGWLCWRRRAVAAAAVEYFI